MSLKSYRVGFLVTGLVLVLVTAFPGLSMFVPLPRRRELFSELWVLGFETMVEGYPFNVSSGKRQGPVYVGVRNNRGASHYYLVYAKFRNQTQPPPDTTVREPSSLNPLLEFRFFLEQGKAWETPVSFTIQSSALEDNRLSVSGISINDLTFQVDSLSAWDSENRGFYFQLFFELWLFDSISRGFQFQNSFVGLWLNITG